MKILLVDDNQAFIDFQKSILQDYENVEILEAFNGQHAIDMLETNPDINLVVMDVNMPILNGIDSLKEIKQNERFKDIAVAIYSTSSSEEDIENPFVLGANIYIKKPSNFNDLKKILSSG